jgi:pimeloyl-ACP methyl ester carboxylesterase
MLHHRLARRRVRSAKIRVQTCPSHARMLTKSSSQAHFANASPIGSSKDSGDRQRRIVCSSRRSPPLSCRSAIRLSDGWNPIRAYWQDASPANRAALRDFLKPESTVWQYTQGVSDPTSVSPDGYTLDNFYLSRPGVADVQLDLFGDYESNVALYPTFQQYFRTHKPPFLAAWGKNDPFFLPPSAEAFKRDIPNAAVRFFDTGHFALETHAKEIAAAIREFLPR